jgi:hypothetical protein
LPDPTTPTGRSDFQWQLQKIWEDPQVRRLALARTRDPEVAQEALQEAYYAVARVRNTDEIRDLKGYFCRVLIRKTNSLLGLPRDISVEDIDGLADAPHCRTGGEPLPPPFDEGVCSDLDMEILLSRFAAQRAGLSRAVPGRSADPRRYRDVIVAIAERVLVSIARRDVSDADGEPALTAAYPEWFAEPELPAGNLYQRFSRARADVRSLLQGIISRDDLLP